MDNEVNGRSCHIYLHLLVVYNERGGDMVVGRGLEVKITYYNNQTYVAFASAIVSYQDLVLINAMTTNLRILISFRK